jgi:hypothetical protein
MAFAGTCALRLRKVGKMSLRIFFWLTVVSLGLIRANATNLPWSELSRSPHWTSDAKLNRFPKSTRGSITISAEGLDFHPTKGEPVHWPFENIRTVDLPSSRKLSLVTYENRRWHLPGDRPFDFELKNAMPPEVAAELVRFVGKPAVNGVPVSNVASFATIAARHPTRTGGSSGVLRFRDDGIDYLAAKGNDSRSWRWADIQTIAHPEPYRLRIGGYLETFDFDLKHSLDKDVFDRVWDHVYAQGLNIERPMGASDAKVH